MLAGVLLVAFPAIPVGADDAIGGDMVVTKGMKPWEGCGECHDLDGVAPNGHFPNLAAQKAEYIRQQMQDFSIGRRANDHGQMGTSAEEAVGGKLDQIVSYFADLPPPAPVPAAGLDQAALARAKSLFEHGDRAAKIPACVSCHGVERKRAFDAPWLEAQQPGYLAKELDDFRSGARTNDPHRWMQRIAQRLSQSDIVELAGYLASLPRPQSVRDGVATRDGRER
jgi:cytochrome c553